VARASQIRKGYAIKWKDKLWRVTDVQQTFVGKRGAYYQMKLTNLDDGHLELQRFSSDEEIEKAFLESRTMQYLYKEGNTYVFMDPKMGEQISIDEDTLSDILPYLTYNGEVQVFTYEGKAVSVEVPASVVLEVVKTDPAVRGDTATTVNKPAELETGLVIKVPAHVKTGDRVQVDSRTGEFLGRA
jgi:elongation factor P